LHHLKTRNKDETLVPFAQTSDDDKPKHMDFA